MIFSQPTSPDEQDTGTFPDGLIRFDKQQIVPSNQFKRRETAHERDYGERRTVNRSAIGLV